MNCSSADRPRRRVLRRIGVIAAALVPAGAITVAAAQPTQAAQCATNAHVYLTNVSPWAIRFEDQPSDGGFNDYYRPAGQPVSLRVGGNGLKVATGISWRVESNIGAGSFPGTLLRFVSRQAGTNCVANETFVNLPAGRPGEVWSVFASYLTGNSGRFIQEQQHFRLTFY
jgi:hypothetical protein